MGAVAGVVKADLGWSAGDIDPLENQRKHIEIKSFNRVL